MRFDLSLLTFLTLALAAAALTVATVSIAAADEPAAAPGRHDMVLMLPRGPLHLRIDLTDGGMSLHQRREDYLDRLAVALDTDGDGRISRAETAKHPLFVGGRRFDGNEFVASLRGEKFYSREELMTAVDRAAGRLMTFRQNNTMADQDMRVFSVLDEDDSGLIDRAEMRTAAARLARLDRDFDRCITFDEFLPQEAEANAAVTALNAEPPGSVHSDMLRDAAEPILAARLIRRYDADRDGRLSAEELGWSAARLAELDADGDDHLSARELTAIVDAEPDLWFFVDLSRDDGEAMQVIGGRMQSEIEGSSANQVRVALDQLTLSIGYRFRDPVAEAERNAREVFNLIDADGNGYLDRSEVAEHQRFERYLFDAMDADGDGRVFAEEMEAYVRAHAEPATTSCQVTLFDMGNGYFQVLDRNGDGRISIRELRLVEQTLLQLAGDDGVINPSQSAGAYRIEVRRGGVTLFGKVDRPEAEMPTALLTPPSGPVWFQRMDRNGDGDVTWDEFLGPREVFERIDRDGDGLIDAMEAILFTKETEGSASLKSQGE